LWEYVQKREKEDDFLLCRDAMDFIRSKEEGPEAPREIRSAEKMKSSNLVPKELHKYLTVFEKKASERMPLRKPWDHAIDMKEDFQPKKAKIYPVSPDEQKEISDFLTDQTQKGYI